MKIDVLFDRLSNLNSKSNFGYWFDLLLLSNTVYFLANQSKAWSYDDSASMHGRFIVILLISATEICISDYG